MAKKKPKRKPLDEAAVARIAARRERKAGHRAARESAREEKTARLIEEIRWHRPEAVAAREIEHAARLADAILVLQRDEDIIAGVLLHAEGEWELMHRSGAIRPCMHADAVEAVLHLCVEAYPDEGDVLTARNDAGAAMLSQVREALYAQYHAGKLHALDEDTFYDYFADEDTRTAIDVQRDAELDEWREKRGPQM